MKNAAVRKINLFLLLTALFVFAGYAEAARQNFGPFSAVVPPGWQIQIDEDDGIVTFMPGDESAGLSIIWGVMEGASLRDIAGNVSDLLDGGRPTEDEDGDFSFAFTDEDGRDCMAFITRDGRNYIIILKHGDHPQMKDLLDSLE